MVNAETLDAACGALLHRHATWWRRDAGSPAASGTTRRDGGTATGTSGAGADAGTATPGGGGGGASGPVKSRT